MPLYEYECDACGQRFELIRRYADPAVEVCARCGKGPVRRLPSSPAIQFKGSGWYVTDYPRKSDTPAGGTKTDGKTEGGGTSDTAAKTEGGATTGTTTKTDTPASKPDPGSKPSGS